MSQIVRRSPGLNCDPGTVTLDEEVVPVNSQPPAGRLPMRSTLLRHGGFEDRLPIRDPTRQH